MPQEHTQSFSDEKHRINLSVSSVFVDDLKWAVRYLKVTSKTEALRRLLENFRKENDGETKKDN